jgi:S-adenosylmethionine-diacylglycerol 3-amino-3-carboxypropyl transferase
MSYKDWLFRNIHGKKLIYNCCWEDPACDRALLEFDQDSDILMITSAGCNALDYLLDNPRSIHCVDLNYRQNAVLDLKMSLFKHGDYDLLWSFFGEGVHSDARTIYEDVLRGYLQPSSRGYWDKNINYFEGRGLRPSFYYRGSSGLLAWLTKKGLHLSGPSGRKVDQLFQLNNIARQRQTFDETAGSIFGSWWARAFNHSAVLSLAGVPDAQGRLLSETANEGPVSYLKNCLSIVFHEIPAKENYFYAVYWQGKYHKSHAPNYLKEEHFQRIRSQIHKIQWQTGSISDAIELSTRTYSHYVLLDHMDWLAAHDEAELEREWNNIEKSARPAAAVLLRSAGPDFSFLPSWLENTFDFEESRISEVQRYDRVGMYQSTGLLRKK